MIKRILAISFTVCAIWGCSNQSKITEKLNADSLAEDSVSTETMETDSMKMGDEHSAMNSLDWDGTYKGILPCADCEGIETTITLTDDQTYTMQTKYLGKSDAKYFDSKGKFNWDKAGQIITLEGIKDAPGKYFVGENTLTQLDMEGKRITGQLADKYILKK